MSSTQGGSISGASIGSSVGTAAGSVLGASSALAASSEILPRTGMGAWVFYLAMFTIAVACLVVFSFALTRIIRRLLK